MVKGFGSPLTVGRFVGSTLGCSRVFVVDVGLLVGETLVLGVGELTPLWSVPGATGPPPEFRLSSKTTTATTAATNATPPVIQGHFGFAAPIRWPADLRAVLSGSNWIGCAWPSAPP